MPLPWNVSMEPRLGAVHSAQARRGPGLHEASIACHEEVRGRGRYGLAGLGGDPDESGCLALAACLKATSE